MCNKCGHDYDYTEARARRSSGKWKSTVTVHLPGDEAAFQESEIGRLQRRDGYLNRQEAEVAYQGYQCAWRQAKYVNWQCTWGKPCVFCEEALNGRVGWVRV